MNTIGTIDRKGTERSLRLIVEKISDAAIIADSNFMITDINDAALDLFGYTKEEVVVLTVIKTEFATEYSQQMPEHKIKVGLYTIKMDGIPKYQLDLNARDSEELLARGFKDLEKVALVIEKSTYRVAAKPLEPDELKFDF
jgi:PAS domain-containing protein